MKYLANIAIICVIILSSCASEVAIEQQNSEQNPEVQTVEVGLIDGFRNDFNHLPQSFEVDAQRDVVLKTKNGSRFHIPKNSFVDASGNVVKGKVQFDIMEFNTRGEIISSNIPMVYQNPAGEKEQFESAGMFSIAAFQNNEPLFLGKGKKIKVEYATNVDGAFNFYKLQSDSSNWELKESNCLPMKNSYLDDAKNRLEQVRAAEPDFPKKPLEAKDDDLLFDIRSFEHNGLNLNRDFNGLMWKYIGSNPELNPALPKNKISDILELQSMEPLDADVLAFSLTFYNKKSKEKLVVEAAPVYKGKLLDKKEKKNEEIIAQIENSAREQNAILKEMANEKELLRVFEVDELAIYNYDIQYKDPNTIQFVASFTFAGQSADNVNVYLLPTAKRVVVKFTPSTFGNFWINPRTVNKIIAILPNKEIYFLSNHDILKMNLIALPDKSKVLFDLKKVEKKIETPADLDKVIDAVV